MSTQMGLVPTRSGEAPRSEPLDNLRMQGLWLVLAKWDWTTLVLLPAHADGSTQEVASALAGAGTSLSDSPVSAVTAGALEADAARTFMVALARRLSGRQKLISRGNDGVDLGPEPSGSRPAASNGAPNLPFGRVILSVPSVASDPVSLAATNAADLVILGVELGKTSFEDLSRSIELIGHRRIAGCVLL